MWSRTSAAARLRFLAFVAMVGITAGFGDDGYAQGNTCEALVAQASTTTMSNLPEALSAAATAATTRSCSKANPCGSGEGSCQTHTHCQPGLICSIGAGPRYGFDPDVNVCQPCACIDRISGNGPGETGVDCGGDCGSCNREAGIANGSSAYCSALFPCVTGEGHCDDRSRPCAINYTCGIHKGLKYTFSSESVSVCQPTHCLNRRQDASQGETDIDCGGPCGSCTRPPRLKPNTTAYCSLAYPCRAGEGTCESDSECATGLTCSSGTCEVPLRSMQLAAGGRSICALEANDEAVCWSTQGGEYQPPIGASAPGPFAALNVMMFNSVACGLRTSGEIACWQIAEDMDPRHEVPKGTGYRQISANGINFCAVAPDDTLTCSGNVGVYGHDTFLPPPNGKFSAVAVGHLYGCGLRADGTVICWGFNNHGQANEPDRGIYQQVVTAQFHACALRNDGTVTCWGMPNDGRLNVPEGTYLRLAAGNEHVCGLRQDRTAVCWGKDFEGETRAPAGTFTEIAAGEHFSCARKTEGGIVCWGSPGAANNIPASLR